MTLFDKTKIPTHSLPLLTLYQGFKIRVILTDGKIKRYVMQGHQLKLESQSNDQGDGIIIEVAKDNKYGTGTFLRTIQFADHEKK